MEALAHTEADVSADIIIRRVEGDEMYPEMPAGSLVQVEPCDRIAGGGGTYLVEFDGIPLLQTVQRLPGRRLRLTSQNSSFEDIIIRQDEDGWVTEEGGHPVLFKVVGRFVGLAGLD